MKKLLLMDAKNYLEDMPEIYRVSIRGIIFINQKMLLVKIKNGSVDLPGGGQEAGETEEDTLVREVLEETGYHVIRNTIKEFGEIEEKRLSTKEPKIWHQINHYYFCDVDPNPTSCHYTLNEINYNYQVILLPIKEAIAFNEIACQGNNHYPWNQREYHALKIIKEYLDKEKNHYV